MKNLKLLSKNYFLVILFSLFFGFATYSQEPVDIWEVGEKKPKENKQKKRLDGKKKTFPRKN